MKVSGIAKKFQERLFQNFTPPREFRIASTRKFSEILGTYAPVMWLNFLEEGNY